MREVPDFIKVKTLYTLNVTREGRWWAIEIPQIDGATQARSLKDVEQMARECIALTLGEPLDEVEIGPVNIRVGDVDASVAARNTKKLREEAERKEALAHQATALFVEQMVAEGVSLRDIADMLGMSFQRIQQIATS